MFLVIGSLGNASFQLPLLYHWFFGGGHEHGVYALLAHFCLVLGLSLVNAKEFADTYKKSVDQSLKLESLLLELKQKEKLGPYF